MKTLRMIFTFSFVYTVLLFPFSAHAAGSLPQFKKVMIVLMENASFKSALKQDGFAEFAEMGALLTNHHGVVHPSQANYVALTAGDHKFVKGDSNQTVDVKHIGDLLEAKGLDWKAYAEDYPENCFLGAREGKYVRKHVPFLSYKNVQDNPGRCNRIVNMNRLDDDIVAGTIPAFSLLVPNLDNDGHDTGPAFASDWLKKYLGPKVKNPAFMKDMLLVITYDESGFSPFTFSFTNRIYTVLIGDSVIPGSKVKTKTNHYDMLRTVEDGFGIGNLGREDSVAEAITGIWK